MSPVTALELRRVLPPTWWKTLIDFGDTGMIAPAFLAAAVMLVVQGRGRTAATWGVAFAACAGGTALLKLLIGGFPSGHSSMSAVFYGGMAMLAWRGPAAAKFASAAFLLLIALVAAAVLALAWHPPIDIAAGLALGSAAAWVALRRQCAARLAPLIATSMIVMWAFHGTRLDIPLDRQRLAARAAPSFPKVPTPENAPAGALLATSATSP